MPLAQTDTAIVRRPAATAGVDLRLALVLVTSLFFMYAPKYAVCNKVDHCLLT